jgi:hypothetical protein
MALHPYLAQCGAIPDLSEVRHPRVSTTRVGDSLNIKTLHIHSLSSYLCGTSEFRNEMTLKKMYSHKKTYTSERFGESEQLLLEDTLKLTRLFFISGLICSSLVVTSTHVVAAEDPFDDNQVPIENRAQNGSLHIISDDTVEESVVDPPSMLSVNTKDAASFCTSAENGICSGQSDLWYAAHLPQCSNTELTDCIVSVSASAAGGTQKTATFDRYFPNLGPQSYTGKPSIKLPTGRAPSVWKIPGAPHIGGDEYAVVARLRGSTGNRKAASFQLALTPVSLKTNADTTTDYRLPNWIQPGRMAGPASDRGLFRCAYWGENGACLLSRAFPVDTSFTVVVRLATEPAGWLHGRINTPTISFTKDGDNTLVSVTASPVQVPAFQVGKQYSEFPVAVQKAFAVNGPYGSGGTRKPGGQDRTDPAERNAEYNLTAYKNEGFEQLALMTDVIGDKAGWAPWMWRVRTLSDDEMNKAGKCLTTGDGVKGIVTTNATIYGSGPPSFNTATSSLDYKVAAPHLTRTGDVFKGAYNLIMRSDVARCFYNFTSAPVKADISVIEAAGTEGKATTSIKEENGWLTLSATGFSHSAPTVRAKLSQDAVATTTLAPTTTTTTTTTLAPVQVTVPVIVKVAGITTKVKKTISGTSLAKSVSLSIPKKAKITVTMASKYAKKCKVSGTSVKTLAKGTCVVKVTVTTTANKKTSKNVTITVN